MKILKVFLLSFALLVVFGLVSGQEETTPAETPEEIEEAAMEAVNLDEDVQPQDLGVSEPRLLPDSPFYFLKNWGREIRSFFTFNPIKRAELRMKFANEKLMEAKKIVEKGKDPDGHLTKKALENYQEEVDKLKTQSEKIKEKVKENPEVDKFLNKFIHQQTLHQKLLQRLETQVPPQAIEKIEEARERHLERFKDVMLKLEDREEKITEKLDEILEKQKGSQFKNFKNLEVLKNLEEKVPEEAKDAIRRAQENALKRLKGNLEEMSPEDQERFKEYIERISGEKEKHLEILEDFKAVPVPEAVKEKWERLQEKLEEGKIKIFEKIGEKLEKLDCPVWAPPAPGFCKEGRVIIEKNPETGCPLPPRCIILGEVMAEKLVTCCIDSVCIKQNKKNCEWAGGRVVDAASCHPNPCEEKKVEVPERIEVPEKPTILERPGVCIMLWDPVCGKDGKTYSNSCFAKSAGMEIDHEGVCKILEEILPLQPVEPPAEEMTDKGCCTPCDDVCPAESKVGCERAIRNNICKAWQTPCPCH